MMCGLRLACLVVLVGHVVALFSEDGKGEYLTATLLQLCWTNVPWIGGISVEAAFPCDISILN
jgi:hypothetical protein